jgi:hypothetical protein
MEARSIATIQAVEVSVSKWLPRLTLVACVQGCTRRTKVTSGLCGRKAGRDHTKRGNQFSPLLHPQCLALWSTQHHSVV